MTQIMILLFLPTAITAFVPIRLVPSTRITNSRQELCALSRDDQDHIRSVGGARADVYGEMTANGWTFLGSAAGVGLTPQDHFLDLGSGYGALVLQAVTDFGVQHSMGIELSQDRHDQALQDWKRGSQDVQDKALLVCGDAAGAEAGRMIENASVVWCSNLLFDNQFNDRLAGHVGTHGKDSVRVLVSLKEFPSGIDGFELAAVKLPVEMSWTAGKAQPGHPPLPGHPCCIYTKIV